jgi:chromosome segregation ATPase
MNQHPSQNSTGGHLGDDDADLWQRAERLCRAVATQELADLPLYIVPQSRLAELGFADDQHGLTCPSLDLYVTSDMSTRSFFDKIIGRQRQRERTALTGYQQLVEAVAHQTEPEVEEVERLLTDSSKSIEDLQRDSERLMRRLGYKDALERLPALHKERAQLDTQIAAADRALEEAEAAHDEATRPLYERRSEVDRAIREAQDAEAKLVTECEDAELRRELEDVDAELIRLSTDRHDLLDQASHLEKQALAEQYRAERQLDPGYARQYREKAAQIEKDAAARRRDAQRVDKAHDELTKRRDRLEKQMRQA